MPTSCCASALEERLQINVELASPPDFIPELPRWHERSPLVLRAGNVDLHHFNPYSQALSKIAASALVTTIERIEEAKSEFSGKGLIPGVRPRVAGLLASGLLLKHAGAADIHHRDDAQRPR